MLICVFVVVVFVNVKDDELPQVVVNVFRFEGAAQMFLKHLKTKLEDARRRIVGDTLFPLLCFECVSMTSVYIFFLEILLYLGTANTSWERARICVIEECFRDVIEKMRRRDG